ncbi:MAG: DUF6197 family protein [Candidatus Thorarchaeota archaeon]|jgi:hypothetical protein
MKINVLKEAKQIVENGWCKYSGAKDRNHDNVAVESSRANSFCTMGAIDRACSIIYGEDKVSDHFPNVFIYFARVNGIDNVIKWNDDFNRSKEEVIDAFDNAIHNAEWEKSCKDNTTPSFLSEFQS